ncbi:hypothetical protein [Ktedonospora formicarum]|uniref:Uncharacterized protein n=1 Tax=Ktedonospora formicarum TaxID=2778364 RepID=A0A8J3MMR0_9CHLR|nr:hypothetical protein [Ktedonospora formicarum]GHO41907.1 hypothetical protein KSX_00700 [Ktedonospora formicarum]
MIRELACGFEHPKTQETKNAIDQLMREMEQEKGHTIGDVVAFG